MTRSNALVLALLVAGISVGACAAEQKHGSPMLGSAQQGYPQQPTPAADQAAKAAESESMAGAPSNAGTQRTGPYAQPPMPTAPARPALGEPGEERQRYVWSLVDDMTRAEADLQGSGADCSAACKALRSMQRAAARLCAIATSEEEQGRCHSAQERVRAARERVRSACGQCVGGPSLDPNAPIDEP